MHRRAFLNSLGAAAALALLGGPVWALDVAKSNFDWKAAAFAWDFSQLAYQSVAEMKSDIPQDQMSEYPGPPGLALHDTQILAWQRDDCTIIAYRGTEGLKALGRGRYIGALLDVLTDARFPQRSLGGEYGAARVHSGFHEAVEETWPFVQAFLDTGKPVMFVGHSLGGALATYAAFKAGPQVSGVWTFGSPRVGNASFAEAYDRALGQVTYRFANELDIVARLPVRGVSGVPLLPEYRHVGQPVVLWADGKVSAEWEQMLATIRLDDHLLSAFSEDLSFAPHTLYEPAVYAKAAPDFVPLLASEGKSKGLLLRLVIDLPSLLNGDILDAIP